MMQDEITILKIDVDKNPHVAKAFQIQGVPTLIIFKDGEIKWRQSGVASAKQLQQVLQQLARQSAVIDLIWSVSNIHAKL